MQITFGHRADVASQGTPVNKFGNPIINPEQHDKQGNTVKDEFYPTVSRRDARRDTREAQKLLASMPKFPGLQGGVSRLMPNSLLFIPDVKSLKSLGISPGVIKQIQRLSHDVVIAHEQRNKLNAEKQAAEAKKLAVAEEARQQVIARIKPNFIPWLRLT